MKSFLITITMMTVAASAFSPSPQLTARPSIGAMEATTKLSYANENTVSCMEVKAALEATDKFGVNSPEALAAWNIVEVSLIYTLISDSEKCSIDIIIRSNLISLFSSFPLHQTNRKLILSTARQ